MYEATVINVMIASPSDVKEERNIIREEIQKWNDLNSRRLHCVLLAQSWETHSAPRLGDRPQAIINAQIVKDSDLLIALFWSRLGTDTGIAESGTVEEIEEHLNAGKTVMLYYSGRPIETENIDLAQLPRLREFIARMKKNGLIEKYSDAEEFREKISRQLGIIIFEKFLDNRVQFNKLKSERTNIDLMPESRELLVAAVESDGIIQFLELNEGLLVRCGDHVFNSPDDGHRSQIRWKAAINELRSEVVIDKYGSVGYQLNADGYKLADKLKEH